MVGGAQSEERDGESERPDRDEPRFDGMGGEPARHPCAQHDPDGHQQEEVSAGLHGERNNVTGVDYEVLLEESGDP